MFLQKINTKSERNAHRDVIQKVIYTLKYRTKYVYYVLYDIFMCLFLEKRSVNGSASKRTVIVWNFKWKHFILKFVKQLIFCKQVEDEPKKPITIRHLLIPYFMLLQLFSSRTMKKLKCSWWKFASIYHRKYSVKNCRLSWNNNSTLQSIFHLHLVSSYLSNSFKWYRWK